MQLDLLDNAPSDDPLRAPSPCGLLPPTAHPPGAWIGTCAWQHADWDGHFYPPGLPKARQLAYYARFHNAVEVDSSFYRVPSPASVDRWRDETPDAFRFCLKAPRTLTHDAALSLDDETARRDWNAFLDVVARLGPKLGVVLVQLGPRVTDYAFDRLQRLGDTVPPAMHVAVEFRHRSWNAPAVNAWLAERGFARAWVDHYLDPTRKARPDDPLANAATGPFLFLRLLGDTSTKYDKATGARVHRYGERLFDRADDLAQWIPRVRPRGPLGLSYILANNHYEGFSPLTCDTLRNALAQQQSEPRA